MSGTTGATGIEGGVEGKGERKQKKTEARSATGTGLRVQRHFTSPDVDPFDTVEWSEMKYLSFQESILDFLVII